MNDVVSSNQPDISNTVVTEESLTAGAMLRHAREAAGLHVAALAVSMKIPVKKLEALEADRLDLLLDAVFVRALASSVCRALKIDSGPVLDKLPKNDAPRLNAGDRGINTPFHAPGHSGALSVPAFFAKPGVLVVLSLLIGVVALVFFPDFQSSDRPVETAQSANPLPVAPISGELLAPPGVLNAVDSPAASPVTQPAAANGSASIPLSPTAPSTDVLKAPVVAAPVAKADSPSTVVPNSAPASGLVVFKARGSAWVEVIDAKGVVQLRKTLSAGETIGASGVMPLSVVIGRVDALDVEVKGKAFNMAGIAKDNVARFEVK